MATVDFAAQVQSPGGPATVMLGPNNSVRGRTGALATLADSLTFGDGGTGGWVVGAQRVRIGGVPAIPNTAVGKYVPGSSSPGPLAIVAADNHVRSR
jgi:hypothetical protein